MQFSTPPKVTANPNPHAPLAAILEFATDEPSSVRVEVLDGEWGWTKTFEDEPLTEHRHAILGLRPGRTHRLGVAARGAGGEVVEAGDLSVTMPPLPEDFPPMTVSLCVPERREPGFMIFSARPSAVAEGNPGFGQLTAIDRTGEIVWFYRIDSPIGDVRRLRNGNLLYVTDGVITEIDMLGDVQRRWYATGRFSEKEPPSDGIPVETGVFHHAAIELPSGNLAACSMEVRDLPGFPTDDSDPAAAKETARVVGDVIVEFQRDGTVVNELRLLDILDPYRICYGSLAAYWVRKGYPDTRDWSHVNGLAYDASDDSIIASARHQDSIVKIGRTNGELVWILGDHGNWKSPWADKLLRPEAGLEWQFHQHDCSVTPTGAVLCFDNGNHRATPFGPKMPDGESYSRAVEFAIDSESRTATQVWAYGDGADRLFSCYQSGAFRLPRTGNTFITYGGVCSEDGKPSGRPEHSFCKARLVEVTAGGEPEIVFEMWMDDSAAEDPATLSAFRAEYVPDLY